MAVSDELGIAGHALRTLRRSGNARDAKTVAGIVAELEAGAVVVGLPEGSEEEGRIRGFVAVLREHLRCPVHTVDEAGTTVEAEQILLEADLGRRRRKRVVDRLAAARILERYLREATS